MTDGTGMPRSADALPTTYLATLLAELARLVGEVELLVAGTHRAGPTLAADIAAQQAAIVDAAHEEAAAVLSAAHAAAARVLDRAAHGQRAPEGQGLAEPPHSVLDLREAPRATVPVDPPSDDAPVPRAPDDAPVVAASRGAGEDSEVDMRASLAAAIDMARGLSERIEQLSQGLHESPTP